MNTFISHTHRYYYYSAFKILVTMVLNHSLLLALGIVYWKEQVLLSHIITLVKSQDPSFNYATLKKQIVTLNQL